MFEVLINQLLDLRSKLESERQARIEKAIAEINQEFAENGIKIQKALEDFGYVEPEQKVSEETSLEEQTENYI